MVSPLRVDGVDISNWQKKPIGWKALGDAGVLFVYHKATEGTGFVDARYRSRQRGCRRAGRRKDHKRLEFGGYHFARPSESDGATQARFFLKHANVGKRDMPPMLDLEDRGGLDKRQLTRWVRDWVRTVEEATGKRPIIYTRFNLGHHFGCALWTASYADDNRKPPVAQPWRLWTVWQFSNGEYGVPKRIRGLTDGGDLNTINAHDPRRVVEALIAGPKHDRHPHHHPHRKPDSKPPITRGPKVDDALKDMREVKGPAREKKAGKVRRFIRGLFHGWRKGSK